MRAGIYARLSRDREDQTSTTRQAKDCKALLASRDIHTHELYEDVDFSAYKRGVRRPAYERMLDDVRSGRLDIVVVWKIDRLARNLREFLRIVDLCEQHHCALISVNEPFDTSSPIGRAIMQVLAVFAELESATIALRVASAQDHAAHGGKPHYGGQRRFGYTREMTIIPDEAAAARDAAAQLLSGVAAYSIARQWNERGFKTPKGGEWRSGDVVRSLRSPHMAALRVHRGEVIGTGNWEPIFTEETHRALQPRRTNRPVRRARWLTGGLARCGRDGCGAPLVGHTNNGQPIYWCSNEPGSSGCGKLSMRAVLLENHVEKVVLDALAQPRLRSALSASTSTVPDDRLARLHAVEQRLEELGIEFAHGSIPMAALRSASAELEREADSLRRSLDQAHEDRVLVSLGQDPAATWLAADAEWKSRVAAALFERVTVLPAQRKGPHFDPNRVRIVPRV
jgi:site-specific DNA recombinase